MNKKASVDYVVFLFRILFLVVVFMSFIFLARAFIVQNIDVFETESKLLPHRIALSSNINHADETGRLYVGIVDLEKFTSDDFSKKMMESIYYGRANSEASAKITLRDLDATPGYDTFYEKYYNKELYDEKKVLVEAKLIGRGSAKRLDTSYYVIIKDNDELRRGILNVEAILPNR